MDTGSLTPAELPFGARVRAVFTKFDGSPHWEYDLVVLGVDEYGVWIGGAPGGYIARPGMEFTSDAHWVTLYPHDDFWVATINDHGGTFSSRIYIDVTSKATWWHRPDGILSVNNIDLDLDVIRRFTGEVFIDDEDEFDEHRVAMNYPADVVEDARRTTAWLYDRLRAEAEPFDQVAARWMTLCRDRVRSDDRGRAIIVSERADAATESGVESPALVDAPADPYAVHDAMFAPEGEVSGAEQGGVPQLPDEEEDLLAVWVDEHRDPLVHVDVDDGPAAEVDRDGDGFDDLAGDGADGVDGDVGDIPVPVSDVEWNAAPSQYGEADYVSSSRDVSRDLEAAEGIDTSPVDPVEVTGLLLTTETGRESPLWFDGRPIDPEEVELSGELADHLRDWSDRWNRDFDPVRGWAPRASICDYEALGRWLACRVKDEVGGLTVTLQLAHLGRSSLTEIAAADVRHPALIQLDPAAPGELPVVGDIVTLNGTVGCFSSEVNARLAEWAASGGTDDVEAEKLRWMMSSELGPGYRVV